MRAALRVSLGLLLLMPYLIWLLWIPVWSWPEISEWLPYFTTALKQAALSAALALVCGFFLFLAAQGWTTVRARALSELALLLPNMVPPLFLVLSLLSWVTPWAAFPYGLGAVIFAHVLLNAGLVAVSLDRLLHSRAGLMAETAWVMGASRTRFWLQVAWPLLRLDVACIFLFVFSLCFTSFSIPLVLGGEHKTTLEVAIYDILRMEGRWDKAVILAALQSVMLFVMALVLPHAFFPAKPVRRALPFLALKGWRLIVFVPAAVILGGWLAGLTGTAKAALEPDLPWVDAFLTTLALGLAAGLLHLILFLVTAYVLPHARLTRFLNGYLAPSSVITAFALLLLPGEGITIAFAKLVVALTLISFPLLYRWIVHSALAALGEQVSVARSLGADWRMILFEIVWPQVAGQVLRACGLAALWAAGDFAVSGVIAGDLNTVPLLMESLLGNYRIETAQLLMFPLLFAGLGLYGLFVGAARHVVR